MRIEKVMLETAKFATVVGNREVDVKRLKEVIAKDGRVFTAIDVVLYKDVKDQDIALVDLCTKQRLEEFPDEGYVILDGQHRTVCALQLYQEMQEKKTDVVIPNFIYANVSEKEDIKGENIISRIMTFNSYHKSWSSKDFIKSAHTHKVNDDVITIIFLLSSLGFSISSISRILFNNHKALTPQVLSQYISDKGDLPEGAPKKALEILRLLIKKGFCVNFLKKRYLFEEIVPRLNSDHPEIILSLLNHLDNSTVAEIQNLSPQHLDANGIRDILNSFKKNLSKDESDTHYVIDLSEKTFIENIDYFKNLVEEQKYKKKNKRIPKNIACSVDDVK